MKTRLIIQNRTAWSTRDLRAIILAGMRSHGLTRAHFDTHYVGEHEKIPAPGCAALRLTKRVKDIGVDGVWAPHEIDDDLAQRVARHVSLQVDAWLTFLRGVASITRTGRAAPWLPEGAMLRGVPPKPAKPKPTREQTHARELARARTMLAKAATRRKRAETIEARWTRRVRTLEKKQTTLAQVFEREDDA